MLIVDNLWVLFHVVALNNLFLVYKNEISDQICIDFSGENGWKLSLGLQTPLATHYLQSLNESGKVYFMDHLHVLQTMVLFYNL